MNSKELNLINDYIKMLEDTIVGLQNKIKFQREHQYASPKEIKESIKKDEYAISRCLDEISTLRSIYTKVRAVQIAKRSFVGKDGTFTENDVITINRAGLIVR